MRNELLAVDHFPVNPYNLSLIFTDLPTSNEAVGLICQRCGKPVVRTAFAEFETLAQVCHSGGEIAHGKVCLRRVGTKGFEFALSESASALYAERTSRKVGMKCVGGIKMTVRVEFLHVKTLSKTLKRSRL